MKENQVRLPYRRGHTVLRQSLPQKTEHVLFVRMTDTQVEDDDGDYALFAGNLIHLGYKSKMSSTIQTQKWEWGWILKNTLNFEVIDWVATVAETWVQFRSDFQSDSRVLKKVFWTFSYLYLWHTMRLYAKKLLKTLKFWKSLNSLCKSGSRPQKSPKIAQKTDLSIAIYSSFWIGMVYFKCFLVNPHVQTVQNMYGKGG